MMQRRLMLSAAAAGALAASGCAGPSVNDYASEKPVLDLRQYFNGVVDAWGIFTDRSGKVVKRFTVVMHCQWNGDQGVLDEDFVYSDGSKQKRIWRLQHLGLQLALHLGIACGQSGLAGAVRRLDVFA
jgi:hypothetical protein